MSTPEQAGDGRHLRLFVATPDRALTRRATLLSGLGGLLGLGGVLSGCGFEPVYAPKNAGGVAPSEGLRKIDVRPIYERPGQILREALLGDLGIEPGTPRHFDLAVNFWITGEALAILDFSQPTRMRMVANANWTLFDHDPKQTKLTEGTERLMDGFDIFDSQYFAVDLDNEAVQRRLAKAMAERITLRLAMWFHQHPTAVG